MSRAEEAMGDRSSINEDMPSRETTRRRAGLCSVRAGRARGTLLVILGAIGLVVLPVVTVEWPREIARWYQAAALESELDGDYASAVARMDRAIVWGGSDYQLHLQRAQYNLQAERWQQGLADCDRARELKGDLVRIGQLRGQLLQHLGRHREAVAEWREIVFNGGEVLPDVRAHHLNGLAYAMAVGDVDLEQGLAAVTESVRLIGTAAAIHDPAGVILFGRAVTAGQDGDEDAALLSLSEAAEHAEAALEALTRRFASSPQPDLRSAMIQASQLQAVRAHVAGILRQRANVNEQLGQSEAAQRDEQRLSELAGEGQLEAAEPYGLPTAVVRVNTVANVLDTRGFLLFKLGDLDEALEDLERAMTAIQWVGRAMPWLVDATKHYVTDIRPLLLEQRQQQRTRAVITYHRLLVLQALGRQDEADRDAEAIRQLGFEPGDHLF